MVQFNVRNLVSFKLLVLFVCTLALAACDAAPPPSSSVSEEVVRPARIERVQAVLATDLVFNGTLRSAQRAEMAFKVAGRIEEIRVNEGQLVQQGDELARLDDREIRAAFNSAQAEFTSADNDYRRGKAIFDSTQAISRRDLERLETQRSLAANRLSTARISLEETILKAPFDGIVSRKLVENFSRVSANQPVLLIQDPKDLEVVIQVPDQVVLQSARRTGAYAEVPGLDQTFPVTLKSFSTEADPVTQTYQVILALNDKGDANILPGMSARVFASQQGDGEHISIPLSAVLPNNQGQQFVWTVDQQSRATLQPVDIGELVGDRVFIRSGLNAGEQIITAGVNSVREGMKVRPMEPIGVIE
ncbi:efflux RND transporter periplasmic adaptor subunit [Nitrincola tibetensis]|uniref:efflux RND transporter periplasmic adaptor subunit n=1 Tax=Nitrincola tibetensis TaxID=2219697 RepID=UPI0013904C93|nr:efflux RND transporter periplasmic adaptor subunit [Nitrincola tibetensis]